MPATQTTPGQSPCSPDRRPPSTRPAPGPPRGAAPTTTGPQTQEPHVVPETPTELEQAVACKESYQPSINYLQDTPLVGDRQMRKPREFGASITEAEVRY